jgi:uncharacterized damage-inducible protein DinB
MNIPQQIAKNLREVHFGGNWTVSDLKQHTAGLSWQQATTKFYSFNTIDALVYHINYYTSAIVKVLQGNELVAHDEFSFDRPSIQSQEDWENLLQNTWADAETLASLVEQLPESILSNTFAEEKYGNYYRNLHGVIEHAHYHLGQIVLIRKLLMMQADENNSA